METIIDTKIMEETGHVNMYARVKAAQRVVANLKDLLKPTQDTLGFWHVEETPRWMRTQQEMNFVLSLIADYATFAKQLEQYELNAKQWRWLLDIYNRSYK